MAGKTVTPNHDPDFYKILGVDRTASQEAIRAAYVALMKRCHPDAAASRESGSDDSQGSVDDLVRSINEAITVLRNPDKKALYDLQVGASGSSRPVPTVRARPPSKPLAKGPKRGVVAAGGLILMGTITWSLLLQNSSLSNSGSAAVNSPHLAGIVEPAEGPEVQYIDVGDAIADVEWIVANGDAEDAVQYSIHCLQELEESPAIRLFDRCVAFDIAARERFPRGESSYSGGFFVRKNALARWSKAIAPLNRRLLRKRSDKIEGVVFSQLAFSSKKGKASR